MLISPTRKAVLFDFDQTLVDSTAPILECIYYALDQMGLPRPQDSQALATIGLPLTESYKFLIAGSSNSEAKRFSQHFIHRADEIMVDQTTIYPDVPEALQALRGRSARIGIISTKFRYRIEAILRKYNLIDYFDIIVGGEDVVEHKPSPQPLLYGLNKLDLLPEESLYVGDNWIDQQTALSAGTGFVGVTTGRYSKSAWAKLGSHCIDASLVEIVNYLDPDYRSHGMPTSLAP